MDAPDRFLENLEPLVKAIEQISALCKTMGGRCKGHIDCPKCGGRLALQFRFEGPRRSVGKCDTPGCLEWTA